MRAAGRPLSRLTAFLRNRRPEGISMIPTIREEKAHPRAMRNSNIESATRKKIVPHINAGIIRKISPFPLAVLAYNPPHQRKSNQIGVERMLRSG